MGSGTAPKTRAFRRLFPVAVAVAGLSGLLACAPVGYARAFFPESAGMVPVDGVLFVEDGTSPADADALRRTVAAAKERVAAVYGAATTAPPILACATEGCFARFGGGRQRAISLGGRVLVLSPRGLTVPILAHEWSHAELAARLRGPFGWVSADVPVWFDEGLAVLVSGEPSHGAGAWAALESRQAPRPALADLRTERQWGAAIRRFGDDARAEGEPVVTYATAGHTVEQWFAAAGTPGLWALIARLKEGAAFDGAFSPPS